MRRSGWLLALLVLAAGILLALCVLDRPSSTPAPQPGPHTNGGTRNGQAAARVHPQRHTYTCVTQEPEHLNPFTVTSNVAMRYVLEFTHDTLMDLDPRTGELRPALAESVVWNADRTAFTVRLRPDVTFADGVPMTLDDVLFTWEVARNEGAALGSIGESLALVGEVVVVSEEPPTFEVRLGERHFAAMKAVTLDWVVVQKRHFLAEVERVARANGLQTPPPGDPAFGDMIAQIESSGPGTGPYRLANWRRSRDLSMGPNPTSWRRRVYPECWNLAGIQLLFNLDPAVWYSHFLNREVDYYMAPNLQQVLDEHPSLREHYRILDYDYLNLGYFLVQWNHQRPALRDPTVRQALARLFDRDTIAGGLFGGAARPAVAPFKPDTVFYPEGIDPPPFDPAAARVLLRDAGWGAESGRPLVLKVLAARENPAFAPILTLAHDAARQAGVTLESQVLPAPTFLKALGEGDWDGAMYYQEHNSWVDPYSVFHSEGGNNFMGYANAVVDDLLTRARAEFDVAARKELYEEFNTIIARDQPAALLVHRRVRMLFNSHIRDAEPGPLGMYPERWWVPE